MDHYEIQSQILKALSHSTRLAILDILRDGEPCVCHIEAILELRQAYISQQLMQYTIMCTPGLVINETLRSARRIPTEAQVTTWLTDALATA